MKKFSRKSNKQLKADFQRIYAQLLAKGYTFHKWHGGIEILPPVSKADKEKITAWCDEEGI